MLKSLLAALVAALVVSVVLTISWMALPFHTDSMSNIPADALDTAKMKEEMPEGGFYHFPGMPDGSQDWTAANGKNMKRRPVINRS